MKVTVRISRGEMRKPTSQYFGVSFSKREQKWVAQYKENGRAKIIAVCASEIDAAKAYAEWAKPLGRPYTLLPI